MLKRNCIIKFLDSFGIEHAVKVEAESMFEAAIRGLQRLELVHVAAQKDTEIAKTHWLDIETAKSTL